MGKIVKFPPKHLRMATPRGERKKPKPRKKMVEVTVYDCPECGTELEKPKDPDVRATMAFYCPNCHYCY